MYTLIKNQLYLLLNYTYNIYHYILTIYYVFKKELNKTFIKNGYSNQKYIILIKLLLIIK